MDELLELEYEPSGSLLLELELLLELRVVRLGCARKPINCAVLLTLEYEPSDC
jgi:hypothetical protein